MKNVNTQVIPNFVTIINGFHIYKVSENAFKAVKRTTNISHKVTDSFTTSTLLEAVSRAMNGQKLASNQLARVRTAVFNFAQNEISGYFQIVRLNH